MLAGQSMEGLNPFIAQALSLLDTAHDLERRAQYNHQHPEMMRRAAALREQSRRLVVQARGSW